MLTLTPDQATFVAQTSHDNGVDPQIAYTIINRESNGNQYGPDGKPLTSDQGAVGVAQVLPSTAKMYGEDPNTFEGSARAGIKHIAALTNYYKGQFPNNPSGLNQMVLTAYHAGQGNVAKGNIGPATQNYVNSTMPQLAANPDDEIFAGASPSPAPDNSTSHPDDEIFQPSAATQPQIMLGDGTVIDPTNSQHRWDQGTTTVAKTMDSLGQFDRKASYGSQSHPYGLATPDQEKQVPVGSYYIKPSADGSSGALMQMGKDGTGTVQKDFGSGFMQGAMVPVENEIRGLNTITGGKLPFLQSADDRVNSIDNYNNNNASMGINAPSKLGKFAGSVLSTGLATAPLPGAGLTGALVQGGVGGALNTTGRTPLSVLRDTAIGTATGGLVHGALSGLPVTQAARTLNDAGVYVTPGAKMGQPFQWLEDLASSVPPVNTAIKSAKNASVESAVRGAYNEALSPLGVRVADSTPVGHGMYQEAENAAQTGYQSTLPHMSLDTNDPAFLNNLAQVENGRNFEVLTPAQRAQYDQFVTQPLATRTPAGGGPITGQGFKDVDSLIGHQASNYSASGNPADRNLGAALQEAQQAVRSTVAGQPQNAPYMPTLNATNDAYANLTRLRDAASRAGSVDGQFSPNALWAAVRNQDSSVGGANIARGTARMQNFAEAAMQAIPKTVADSGTAERVNMSLLMNPHTAVPTALGMGVAHAALGNPAGRSLIDNMLFNRPQVLQYVSQLPVIRGMFGSLAPAGLNAASNTPQPLPPLQ